MKRIKILKSRFMPKQATKLSAGFDLHADLSFKIKFYNNYNDSVEFNDGKGLLIIKPKHRVLINTGIKIELPKGYEAQVRARSGLSIKKGLMVVNGVGTIDADYRGYIKVALINNTDTEIIINDGDRIAQLIVQKITKIKFKAVESINENTERKAGGFGSTGK